MTSTADKLRELEPRGLDELDERLDAELAQLQIEVAALSIFLPDLSDRQKRLIDNVLATIDDWERTR